MKPSVLEPPSLALARPRSRATPAEASQGGVLELRISGVTVYGLEGLGFRDLRFRVQGLGL